MIAFIDEHRDRVTDGLRWGDEPICDVLREHTFAIAPSTYYAAMGFPPDRGGLGHAARAVTVAIAS